MNIAYITCPHCGSSRAATVHACRRCGSGDLPAAKPVHAPTAIADDRKRQYAKGERRKQRQFPAPDDGEDSIITSTMPGGPRK